LAEIFQPADKPTIVYLLAKGVYIDIADHIFAEDFIDQVLVRSSGSSSYTGEDMAEIAVMPPLSYSTGY
jgi:hypothetical protein